MNKQITETFITSWSYYACSHTFTTIQETWLAQLKYRLFDQVRNIKDKVKLDFNLFFPRTLLPNSEGWKFFSSRQMPSSVATLILNNVSHFIFVATLPNPKTSSIILHLSFLNNTVPLIPKILCLAN